MYLQKLFIYFIHLNTWIFGICKGTSIVGNGTSLNGIPEVIIPEKAVLVPYGGSVKLTCYVTSIKPVSISWKKANQWLPVDKHSKKYHIVHIVDSEGYETSLISINNISKSDIGEYHCVANYSHGEIADVATLYGFIKKEETCVGNEIKTTIKQSDMISSGSTLHRCKNFKILILSFLAFVYKSIFESLLL